MRAVSFYSKLFVVLIVFFGIHLALLNFISLPVFDNKIIESYLINFITAILLYFVIDKHKAKFKDNIGFIFMLSSFFKFGLFFIFINPTYKVDGDTSRLEFFTFFTSYVICLIMETYELIKLLNKLDYDD